MEQNLLSNFKQTLNTLPKPYLKSFSIARTLITNPSTTNQTISSIIQTLTSNPNLPLHHVITLLSHISTLHPHLSPTITTVLLSLLTRHAVTPRAATVSPRAVTIAPNTPVLSPPASNPDLGIADMTETCPDAPARATDVPSRAVEIAVSTSVSSNFDLGMLDMTEECPAVASRANPITPRAAALALSTLVSSPPAKNSDVGTTEMTEGVFLGLCFGSSVPVRHRLLLDAERYDVRPSILLTVFLGFTNDPYPYVRKAALDGLISLCNRVVFEDRGVIEGCYLRGVELLDDVEECVRCSAVRMVSEWGKLLVENSEDESKRDLSDALYVQLCSMVRDMSMSVRVEAFNAIGKAGMVSQYLLMQTLSKKVLDEIRFPGKLSGKHFRSRALSAAGAFLHGLEDEFYEVRSAACYSLRMPAVHCDDLAEKVLGWLMDVLNDDSMVVRLQALETMHHMAVFGHLKVQEMHMHMFLGTLVDMNSPVRFTARKVLRLTKFDNMPMFKLAINSLIHSLESYPQDEPDVLAVVFEIGRNHGNFAVSITEETFLELEPSASNWEFNSSKTAAMLTLAISAPLSREMQQHEYIIPPTVFSYAVTMLGRIANGLTEVMDRSTLLSYLSHCSISTGPHPIEAEDDLTMDINCQILVSHVADPREPHDKEYDVVKFVLANIAEIWQPMIKLGCTSELLATLRSWKEELTTHITYSRQSSSVLTFTLQYLHVVKFLSKAWWHVMHPSDFIYNEVGEVGYVLQKLEMKLRELRYLFIGLSKEEELHIEELTLVAYTLRLSTFDPHFNESALKKLLNYKETSTEQPSRFLTELMKTLQKDESDIHRFHTPLELLTLKQLVLSQDLRHTRAEVEIQDNNWLKPFPFVAGLPVGIPLKMKLHNTPLESKLWLKMTRSKDAIDYVFIDLKQFEGCDEMREFRFIAPFYKTPKVNSFVLLLCIGLECEDIPCSRGHGYGGPNYEVINLCKEKQAFFSTVKNIKL